MLKPWAERNDARDRSGPGIKDVLENEIAAAGIKNATRGRYPAGADPGYRHCGGFRLADRRRQLDGRYLCV